MIDSISINPATIQQIKSKSGYVGANNSRALNVPDATEPAPIVIPNDKKKTSSAYEEASERVDTDSADLLETYANIKAQNEDFIGWIKINDTEIDYPVMYSADEPEKYLHRDFDGSKSEEGLPFVDHRCSVNPDSDNVIIYAHNMKSGSMFASLEKYANKDYYAIHPVIDFNSLDELRQYEVVCAFYDRVYYSDEEVFKFYNILNIPDEGYFRYVVDELRDKALYDTGVSLTYGDSFITLVTCSYQEENGRFVVVARRSHE